jgi:hypothetical protein
MIKEYSEYSGKSVDILESNISICNKLITEEISSYQKNREKSTIDILVDSKNLIYDIIRYPFNIDKAHLLAKYQLFSPYMMNMIISSGYTSFLEYMGGVGVLSEIIKENLINSKVTFNSINNEIFHFSKWRFEKKGLDISTIGYIDKDKNYDVVVSDGFLQYLDSPDQEYLVQSMIDITSKNGLLCLLVDISGENPESPLKKNVDILRIHSILEQSDMVCIYGKNTFSSLWKKMI